MVNIKSSISRLKFLAVPVFIMSLYSCSEEVAETEGGDKTPAEEIILTITENNLPVSSFELKNGHSTILSAEVKKITDGDTIWYKDYKSIVWGTSNSNIVSIQQEEGIDTCCTVTTTITDENFFGKEAFINVMVDTGSDKLAKSCIITGTKVPVEKVAINVTDGITVDETTGKKTLSIDYLDTYQMTATVTPEDATNPKINWTSSAPDKITVDENGLVTVLDKADDAWISAVSAADNRLFDICLIDIIEKNATSISISQGDEITMKLEEKITFDIIFEPSNTSEREITWSIANGEIADYFKVEGNTLTAIKPLPEGKNVTATAPGGAKDEILIKVSGTSGDIEDVTDGGKIDIDIDSQDGNE